MELHSRMPLALRYAVLAAATIAIVAWVISRGPLPQDQSYHRFADARALAGIPNFLDTMSNLAFLAVGLWGCAAVLMLRNRRDSFESAGEAAPYLVFFGGMCLIAAGSMYYHLDPRDWTLLWDRLPMTVSFMAFFAIVIGERTEARRGLTALPALIILGMAGAVYWYATERAGHGDLRAYILIQFYPIVIIPLASLLLPGRYTHGWVFTLVIAIYAGAKVLEVNDMRILRALDGTVSGHSLKHLAAAAAALPVLWMIKKRKRSLTAQ